MALFSPLYAAAVLLHRRVFLRPKLRDPHALLPHIVIGALRAGGSGKTAVTLALARHLTDQGLRVGVLAYWLGKRRNDSPTLRRVADDLAEVKPDSDWRLCSDEAVLLARKSGARVFVTRHRERAWNLLTRQGGFDVLLSDDGLMDTRLQAAFRIVLRAEGEWPGLFDLLPAGPYRLTARALRHVDCVVPADSVRRTLEFPEGWDRGAKWWAVSGLGQPERFERDLRQSGIRLRGVSRGPDHGLPSAGKLRRIAKSDPGIRFLCTAKDGIKLESISRELGGHSVVGERVELGSTLLSAVSDYLQRFASS